MNLLQIARRVKSESGRSGTGPAALSTAAGDDLRIFNAAADAWRELQMEPLNWAWMRSEADKALTSGVCLQTLALLGITDLERWVEPTDEYQLTAYMASDPSQEWPLQKLSYETFRQRFLVGTHEAGAPQFVAFAKDGALLIGPKPDAAAYKVRGSYYTMPSELDDDAATPEMPERFHMILVWMALMQVGASDASAEHYARARESADVIHSALVDSQGEKIRFEVRSM